jgi:nucleoside-diphosphate-sugar epimerase
VLRFALFMAADSAHTQNFVEAARQGRFTMSGPLDGFISLVDVDDAAAAVVAALDAPAGIYNVAEPDPVRRSAHRDALAAAVSRDGLSAPAEPTDRLDGQLVDSLARSHRISSRALQSVTSWRPLVKTVERWAAATA